MKQKKLNNLKIKVDGKQLSSKEIEKKQDFHKIMKMINKQKNWKNPWFFGAVGISILALLFSIT